MRFSPSLVTLVLVALVGWMLLTGCGQDERFAEKACYAASLRVPCE
jgi:hypothetical protein